jgi:nitroreductase
MKIILDRVDQMKSVKAEEIGQRIALNVAIAIEHMILRALDFGLGSCWVRLIHEQMVKDIFGWGENIFVVALLPIGYPAESPPSRKRLQLEDILIE